ncbi:MAG: hypothetical protein QOK47_1033 [Actinomycetota bacterium]|nr:hypothetical protein [Actinomycetota bacterium]
MPRTKLVPALVVTFVSSIFHYTDNYLRYEQYPSGDPPLIARPTIWIAWLAFTGIGILGYLLYRQGRLKPAGLYFAIYSISGLVSPLHYLYGSLSDFDLIQHVFILTDGIAGAVVLWLSLRLFREGSRTVT